MIVFQEYLARPDIRLAFQLKEGEHQIHEVGPGEYVASCLDESGHSIPFCSHELPKPNGWVILLNQEDVYYCPEDVFKDRYIIPDDEGGTDDANLQD